MTLICTDKISDQWRTPNWLFDELNEEFHFDIDLCANPNNSKCKLFCKDYLKEDITQLHIQTAFMNPPYSNPKPFIEKAWEDSKHCKIICLVKVDPSTKWWSTFWCYEHVSGYCDNNHPKPGCKVRFFPKRIKFDPPHGVNGRSGPTFPCCLVIFHRRESHQYPYYLCPVS